MKDIDHWLDGLTGLNNKDTPKDVSAETDVLKAVLAIEHEEQHKLYQSRATQDWPHLLNRLKKENLLDEKKKYSWFSDISWRSWKLHVSAGGAALAVILLTVMFFSPQQSLLIPQISDSYTLYPHFRGGPDTIHTIQKRDPEVYTVELLSFMNRHKIPYKLDRLPRGWQLEYFLPDTLPDTATNTIAAWPIPQEQGLWHVIHIKVRK